MGHRRQDSGLRDRVSLVVGACWPPSTPARGGGVGAQGFLRPGGWGMAARLDP
jgi:hypothetical protein